MERLNFYMLETFNLTKIMYCTSLGFSTLRLNKTSYCTPFAVFNYASLRFTNTSNYAPQCLLLHAPRRLRRQTKPSLRVYLHHP